MRDAYPRRGKALMTPRSSDMDDLLIPPKRRRRRRAGTVVAVVVAVVLISGAAAGFAVWWNSFNQPAVEVAAGLPVSITVPQGATTPEIGELLASEGVVANANEFRTKVRTAGAGAGLRAGEYELTTGMSYEDAIDALTRGPAVKYTKVTIPEGWRVDQVAARIEKQTGIPADEFLSLADSGAGEFAASHPYLAGAYRNSLEGFLFPKTYMIEEGSSARDVIEMMLDQFDTEVASVAVSRAKAQGISLPQLVTMASIVERETKLAKERPLVASVIYNRLDSKMRLDMCSTIEYVLKEHKLRLSYADLKIDSPYNTYRRAGLPPGPIASPGLASLKAAAAPADTKYLYYVLTGKDGSHTFARNAAEFARAKAKSKRVFGE
jgi:UPF0755 protein